MYKLLDLASFNGYTFIREAWFTKKLFHSIKGECKMRTLFLSSLCVVLLSACGIASAGTATPTPTETSTSTPVQLPTSTYTESPSPTLAGMNFCVVPALLNLRSGPGTQYSIVAIEAQGICGMVTARNEDASWAYISTGKYTGWAFVKYLSGKGDLTSLPLFTALTPTP